MARLPLLGGAYTPRSVIANCQKCINLYPEKNAVAAPVPLTHYQRPGLRPVINSGVDSPVRCLYRASNGDGYTIIGDGVYYIAPDWTLQGLGTVTPGLVNPCTMIDNAATILIGDGSQNGWTINMSTRAMAPLNDPTGAFRGATSQAYMDGYILSNVVGTNPYNNEFISTLINSVSWDPYGDFSAYKTAYPDPLMAIYINYREIYLIGQLKTEVWFNAGLAGFPFMLNTGMYFEHGTVAKFSVASNDVSVFLLGQDLQGQGVVWRFRGYQATRISNHAVEYQIMQMAQTVGIEDAIGYVYQLDGHFFYVLQFPKGDQTWVFDDSLGQDPDIAWHQEGWSDPDTGVLHRHRGNCHAFFYGWNVVGDWDNGTIYVMDMNVYNDTVAGVVCPIKWLRTFPHIGTGEVEIGIWGKRPVAADGRRIQFTAFMLDLECGLAPVGNDGQPPRIALRYSDDRGRTFSSDVLQTGGEIGAYLTQPQWRGLGIARDRVFEVEYSFDGPAALNGAWVEGTVLES